MKSLKKETTKAFIWDLASKFSIQGIGLLTSIFLARLLSPAEFGIVGIALVFIGVSQILQDVGFGAALIQQKNNDSLSYSSVFFLNLFLSLILFFIFQCSAQFIARFFEEPKLTNVIQWLSMGIILNALNIVQISILKRNLLFKELGLRLLISGVISGIISIYLAFNGYGVYALVAQYLLATTISTLILWKISKWRPKLAFSWKSLNSLLSFSGYHFLSGLGDQLLTRANNLVIGKLFSTTTLGFFSLADNLNRIVVNYSSGSINNVFFPVLSKIQNDLARFREIFLKILNFASFLTFLLTGIMLLSAHMLIIILFGYKWLPSVLIFQILVFRSFNYPINSIIITSF